MTDFDHAEGHLTDEQICAVWEGETGTRESDCPWDVIGFARTLLDAAPTLLAGDAQAPAILERLRGILMNHEQPHLAVRMSDALKAIDSALAAPTLPAAQEKEA